MKKLIFIGLIVTILVTTIGLVVSFVLLPKQNNKLQVGYGLIEKKPQSTLYSLPVFGATVSLPAGWVMDEVKDVSGEGVILSRSGARVSILKGLPVMWQKCTFDMEISGATAKMCELIEESKTKMKEHIWRTKGTLKDGETVMVSLSVELGVDESVRKEGVLVLSGLRFTNGVTWLK